MQLDALHKLLHKLRVAFLGSYKNREVLELPALDDILFLDIDGVLHPLDAVELGADGDRLVVVGEDMFRWTHHLQTALRAHPHVRVVIHSSWRYLYTDTELKTKLPGWFDGRLIGTTDSEVRNRWLSIRQFVERHAVRRFIIIDDDASAFPSDLDELIAVNPQLGLSDLGVQAKLAVALERWSA